MEFKDYPNKIFIETGAFRGNGIEDALRCDFEKIYSIELCEDYYKKCEEKFKDNKRVNLILGDSGEVLYDLIKDIDTPITFWLDAHFSKRGYGKKEKPIPLMEELEQIKRHYIKTHTILIDDINYMKDGDGRWSQLDKNINEVIEYIKTINPKYRITDKCNYEKYFLEARYE